MNQEKKEEAKSAESSLIFKDTKYKQYKNINLLLQVTATW